MFRVYYGEQMLLSKRVHIRDGVQEQSFELEGEGPLRFELDGEGEISAVAIQGHLH